MTRFFVLFMLCCAHAAPSNAQSADQPTTESGHVVDASTLTGKIMCGYQGWFNCEGDGAGLGWTHWARRGNRPFGPGNVTVDLWPDMSEATEAERYPTGFKHADGSVAEVFTSANLETVRRHFRWMREYGIDGAFLQRFANGIRGGDLLRHKNQVLANVRQGAKEAGRVYAVMYDLSGLGSGDVDRVRTDWESLQAELKLTADSTYLHHNGKPVVAVWGIGFNDNRRYSIGECLSLVNWLKSQNCTVMIGVPTYWRNLHRDALDDPMLHEVIEAADIISPWNVGRFGTPADVSRHYENLVRLDQVWCKARSLDYLPVVFPGFSWHNLKGDKLDAIPRLRGQFLWSQIVAAKRAGCEMIYVAMFDEVDEGTAIFKCTNEPPVGENVKFLTYEGLPSDHYLKLVGEGGKLVRGEIPIRDDYLNR